MNAVSFLAWILEAAACLVLAGCSAGEPLPILGEIPRFELVNQQGVKFDRSKLNGHVWVADFIYTNCPGPCPLMSSRMRRIQGATGTDVRLVSFSVDPARDTPEALAQYGRRYGADDRRWAFLTGDAGTLNTLDQDAFKLGAITASLDHSTRFVLIDRKARIRAYYGMTEPDVVSRIAKDAARLEREHG